MTDAERWFREKYSRTAERDPPFETLSGEGLEPLYGPEDVRPLRSGSGFPASFPSRAGCTR